MRIDSSVVAMQSERSYSAYAEHTAASLSTTSNDAVILDFSDESKSLLEQLKENKEMLHQTQKEKQNENAAKNFAFYSGLVQGSSSSMGTVPDKRSQQIETLRRILEMLNNARGKKRYNKLQETRQPLNQIQLPTGVGAGQNLRTVGNGTVWTKTTVQSSFVAEAEYTAYEAQGYANTADGRQISFQVSVEMSRAFQAKYESLSQEAFVVTDPLVINLDSATASVTDQKFMFDLNSDGKEEEISFAGKGSGFLALDKNRDGKINDGNELFGTKSGNGFKDLAEYDSDGDGWIDEDDEVFQDLRVWTKDENGKDQLMTLKEANVGAIYLGYADTQFSLNNNANETNAFIRSTGVYLKETGEAGTVQHVDLVL